MIPLADSVSRRRLRGSTAAIAIAALFGLSGFPYAMALPAAITDDPAVDAANPATSQGVQFTSAGSTVNAELFRPAGPGVHPTVLLLHGLPGNEQNLDLARAMQRSGWTVITFHYRGAWGSGGRFTLRGGVADAKTLLALLGDPRRASAWGVDSHRIVVMGHSYGGYVAAASAAAFPAVIGVGLIAPWDISYDRRAWGRLSPAELASTTTAAFDDCPGRLGAVTIRSLTADLMTNGAELDLSHTAPAIGRRPILLLTATRDDPDDQAADLKQALHRSGARQLTTQTMQTDHAFDDHRIALETAVLTWLQTLDGAPHGR